MHVAGWITHPLQWEKTALVHGCSQGRTGHREVREESRTSIHSRPNKPVIVVFFIFVHFWCQYKNRRGMGQPCPSQLQTAQSGTLSARFGKSNVIYSVLRGDTSGPSFLLKSDWLSHLHRDEYLTCLKCLWWLAKMSRRKIAGDEEEMGGTDEIMCKKVEQC